MHLITYHKGAQSTKADGRIQSPFRWLKYCVQFIHIGILQRPVLVDEMTAIWKAKFICETEHLIKIDLQSGPQPELDIWWRHRTFQDGAHTKGHDVGSLLSSFLGCEVRFSHSTLGTLRLNDNETDQSEKNGVRWSLACDLDVKRLKLGVTQRTNLADQMPNI